MTHKLLMSKAPAGGGGFSPDDIAGLVGWWDASDAATITASYAGGGGYVSSWADKSTVGRDATQGGTDTVKPQTGTRTKNGLNVLEFNGDDRLNFTGFDGGKSGSPFTLLVVGSKDAVTSRNMILAKSGDGGQAYFGFSTSSFSGANYGKLRSTAATATASITTTNYGLLFGKFDGTNQWTVGNNGGNTHTVTDVETTAATWDAIGAYPASANFYLDGSIAEIVLYDTALSAGDVTDVESYLNTKWGL